MRVFRKTDGYTEVAAVPRGDMVELYVSYPGEQSGVVHTHFSAKLAWRLAVWLLHYWIVDRLFGWKERRKLAEQKRLLLIGADKEGQSAVDL